MSGRHRPSDWIAAGLLDRERLAGVHDQRVTADDDLQRAEQPNLGSRLVGARVVTIPLHERIP